MIVHNYTVSMVPIILGPTGPRTAGARHWRRHSDSRAGAGEFHRAAPKIITRLGPAFWLRIPTTGLFIFIFIFKYVVMLDPYNIGPRFRPTLYNF
jgi:hypothetical protein